MLLSVVMLLSFLCYSQLDAPNFYRNFREVGTGPGEFLAFWGASN